jgi:hypothetical protein
VADAIISNPVCYAHIHCAEALGVPLHLMFPQVALLFTQCAALSDIHAVPNMLTTPALYFAVMPALDAN